MIFSLVSGWIWRLKYTDSEVWIYTCLIGTHLYMHMWSCTYKHKCTQKIHTDVCIYILHRDVCAIYMCMCPSFPEVVPLYNAQSSLICKGSLWPPLTQSYSVFWWHLSGTPYVPGMSSHQENIPFCRTHGWFKAQNEWYFRIPKFSSSWWIWANKL